MTEMPSQVNINAPVSGQVAVGTYINQFQNVSGCKIIIRPPGQLPKWERYGKPRTSRPRPPKLFLDRTAEIQLVSKFIQTSEPLTLSGMVGIGKSTLLRQIVHQDLFTQFPDSLFCFSAYNLKLDDLLQCLFSAFYESNIPVKPDRVQLQLALQEVKALVVIDDLSLSQDEIQVVLDIAPNCMFVVASTLEVLQGGAGTIRLGGLPEADSVLLFQKELGRDLLEQERQIVCEISQLLKGHPESLRWLAATVREDRLALDGVLQKIKGGSLEVFFRESIQSLPDLQKKILAILTTLEGRTLPLEHLAGLLPSEPIQPAVNSLEDRVLIRTHSPAYSMSASFSGMLSRSWPLTQWEERVTSYFVTWLGQKPARQAVDEVRDLLLALMRKAALRKNWASVVRLGRALEPILILHGYWQLWNEILRLVLEAARAMGERKLEGWALHQLGSRSLCLGARDEAVTFLKQAESIRKAIGDKAGLQLTRHNLSLVTGPVPVSEPGTAAAAGTQPLMLLVGIGILVAVVLGIVAVILTFRPRPPAPLEPPNEFRQSSGSSPVFVWRSVLGGSTYQFQLDDQADFTSPVHEQTVAATSLTPDLILEQGVYYWHVRAISRFNRAGGWGTTRQFTVSIPPGLTTLLEPPDQYVETNPVSLVFRWTEVENAASYRIQIDDNNDFSSPESEGSVPGTEYFPPEPLAQGSYSWRVQASNVYDTPGGWSNVLTFIVSIPPDRLTLNEPANGSKLESTTRPGFQWSAVENAAEYQIQVDDSPDFSSPQIDSNTTATDLAAPTSLEQGIYSWRVRAINNFGTAGDWSDTWDFVISIPPGIPALVSPTNGSILETTSQPSLEWRGVENAARYEIQVDESQSFDSLDYSGRTSEPVLRLPDPLKQGTYYWHVRALNTYDTAGDWSGIWEFTISLPPKAPILVAPSNQSKFESPNSPTFSWQGVPNAELYEIQVDNSTAFDSLEYGTTAANTSRTSGTGFSQGAYSWRVRGINQYKTPGEWSSTWQFIISVRPGVPSLKTPGPGTTLNSAQPTFTWDNATNAAYYEIQVDNSSSFSSPEYDRTTGRNTHTTGSALAQGNYLWRVRAFNLYDTPGDWSGAWALTISIPPPAPTLIEPAQGAQVSVSSVALRWNTTTNAAMYLVQVDNSSSFSSPEYQESTSGTSVISRPLGVGKYYWRVQAYNSLGAAGEWSAVRDFTIPLPAPVLISPAYNSIKDYVESYSPVTFDWSDVPNAARYQIQVDNDSNFSSPEVNTSSSSSTLSVYNGLSKELTKCGNNDFPYYWRVRAIDQSNTPGYWSSAWYVIVRIYLVC